MKKKFTILALLLLASMAQLFSQDIEVPKHYMPLTEDNFAKYETQALEAANWLIATPFNEKEEKRTEVSAFLFKWVEVSTSVDVEIGISIVDFDKKNPGMLMLFAAGCVKYTLENNYSKDTYAKHKVALKNMIEFYQRGGGINKDSKMEQLCKSDENGKLDKWMEKNM